MEKWIDWKLLSKTTRICNGSGGSQRGILKKAFVWNNEWWRFLVSTFQPHTHTRSFTSVCSPSVCLISVFFSGHTFVFLGTSASGCVLLGCEYFSGVVLSQRRKPWTAQQNLRSWLCTTDRTLGNSNKSNWLFSAAAAANEQCVLAYGKRSAVHQKKHERVCVCVCMKKNNQARLLSSCVWYAPSLSDTQTHTNWRLSFYLSHSLSVCRLHLLIFLSDFHKPRFTLFFHA